MSNDKKESAHRDEQQRLWGGVYPTIVDLLAILGIFMLAQIASLGVTFAMGYGVDRSALDSADEMLREATQQQVGLFSLVSYSITMTLTIIFAFVLGRIRGNRAVVARLSVRGFNPSVLLWSMAMLICVAVIFDPLTRYLPAPPQLDGRGWAMIVTLVVAAPIFEELLCRGIILEAIRAKSGVWMATILSSLLFAVLHFHVTASLNALVVGIILAYIYIRTDSLFAPIMLHVFNNALAYMFIWAGYETLTLHDIIPSRTIYIAVYITAIVVLVVSFIKISRQLSRKQEVAIK